MGKVEFRSFLLILALFLFWDATLVASGPAVPDDARALLHKAAAHYKLVGRQKALSDFTSRREPFADHNLYVLCIDANRVMVANGGFPEAVGTPADTVVDTSGKGVGKAAWDAVSEKGEGVVHYRWVNPATHNLEWKTTIFAKVGGDVCGVGAYESK
jgi:hypothetical protein